MRRQRPLATGRRTTRTRSGDAVQNYSGRTPCSKNDIVEGTAAGTGREGGQAETAGMDIIAERHQRLERTDVGASTAVTTAARKAEMSKYRDHRLVSVLVLDVWTR